jgi:hypothetical protein
MKIKLIICTLLLIAAGCNHAAPSIKLSPDKYAVSVMVLELSAKAKQLLADRSEENLIKLINKCKKSAEIPTLYLRPGQTREYDNRISHNYLIVSESLDSPGQYGNVTDGEYVQITFTLMGSGNPCLGLLVNAPEIISWKEVRAPGKKTLKEPVCSFLNIKTTLSPPWGKWRVAGQGEDRVLLVRIDKPLMPM